MPLAPGHESVLVIDDEPSLRAMLEIALKRTGRHVETASGVRGAETALARVPQPYPLVITDLVMPDGSGMDVLAAAKRRSPATEVIVMTAHGAVDTAIEAMRRGAYDFILKPFSPAHMLAQAEKALDKRNLYAENQRLRAQLERPKPSETLEFGSSPKMRALREVIDRIASTKTTVLITGESGTGKERIARYLHERSDRAAGPFRVVNCGALPEALMESELFGHMKGAFTGALASTPGLFREAEGGTLLLDEVGELPVPLQVKLLRVLQEKRIRPVGAAAEIPVDVRVLAATNREVEHDAGDDATLHALDLTARLLGDEEVVGAEEGHRDRLVQTADHRGDAEIRIDQRLRCRRRSERRERSEREHCATAARSRETGGRVHGQPRHPIGGVRARCACAPHRLSRAWSGDSRRSHERRQSPVAWSLPRGSARHHAVSRTATRDRPVS